nr:immunoglobulin light chain junction region [Macaca mulatta]
DYFCQAYDSSANMVF